MYIGSFEILYGTLQRVSSLSSLIAVFFTFESDSSKCPPKVDHSLQSLLKPKRTLLDVGCRHKIPAQIFFSFYFFINIKKLSLH